MTAFLSSPKEAAEDLRWRMLPSAVALIDESEGELTLEGIVASWAVSHFKFTPAEEAAFLSALGLTLRRTRTGYEIVKE